MNRLLLICLFWLCFTSSGNAVEWKTDIVLSPAPMSYVGPADSIATGAIVGSAWSTEASVKQVFWCGFFNYCSSGTMEPSSSAVSTGMTVMVNGINYTIFETGVQGIGFILGLKDYNGTTYVPLQSGPTQTYPAEGTSENAQDLGWSAKVTFVKTGQTLASGVYNTSTINAAVLTARNNGGAATASVIIHPTTITVTAAGCVVATKTASVDLGTIDVRNLSSIGSSSPSGSFNVVLNCDNNVAVNAVVTDQSNPSNSTSTVSLTSDSTASGLGVEFFYNGIGPLMLGPDSSVVNTLNQFYIQTTTQAQTLSLPFQVRFIRTGNLEPGTANALASITFSYQ